MHLHTEKETNVFVIFPAWTIFETKRWPVTSEQFAFWGSSSLFSDSQAEEAIKTDTECFVSWLGPEQNGNSQLMVQSTFFQP